MTLNGVSLQEECDVNEFERFDNEVQSITQKNFFNEIVTDIVEGVRTPTPPLPDMIVPEVFAREFERNNKKYGLYFGNYEMNAFYELISEAHMRIGTRPEDDYWDGSIDYIYDLIQRVDSEISRNNLMITFNRLVNSWKKQPFEKSLAYSELRDVIIRMSQVIPALDEKFREELGMMEHLFEYITDEMTPEEINKMKEDKENRKNEWNKKRKKPPKTEQEEAHDNGELHAKISEAIKHKVVSENEVMGGVEENIEMKTLEKQLNEHIIMNREKWDEFYRKKSVIDIGCEGKNVLLRLDLDVPLSEYIPPEEKTILDKDGKPGPKVVTEAPHDASARSDFKSNPPTSSKRSKLDNLNTSERNSKERTDNNILATRQIIDSTKIKKCLPMIKYMIENLATRTFIVANLSDKSGKFKAQNTMRFVWNALTSKVDQPIHFQDEYELEHDSEGIFMLENLNFHPEEWGFIEPDPIVKPENPEGEGDEEKEPEPVDDKNKGKGNPKDKKAEEAKKKAEEEAKKKAEEEKKQKELEMKKAAEEGEQQNMEGEGEGEAEPEPIPDITYKEIEAFKSKLSSLADIYINDALDASLTHSNTIADLRIPVKVMGIRMTEEVRKLGMFFKYPHSPTFAIVGGTFKWNISDRILLLNSLIYSTDTIFIWGGFALYFLKALGIKLGSQHSIIQDKYLKLWKDILLKAYHKGVKIILPTDFVTLSKPKLGADTEVKTGEIGHETTDHMTSFKPGETAIDTVGEVNWIDLVYDESKQIVDFSNFIEKRLHELYNPDEVSHTPLNNSPPTEENKEGEAALDSTPHVDPVPSHELESKAYILEYGGSTMQNVLAHTKDAMKLFWDGSISIYPDTFAHENNKTMTFDLLRIRTENEDRTEPKYSLIHSEETEISLNS